MSTNLQLDRKALAAAWRANKITDEEYRYLRSSDPTLTAEQALRLAKDGPRYKALGNSMAVPVMRWIGERIEEIEGYQEAFAL